MASYLPSRVPHVGPSVRRPRSRLHHASLPPPRVPPALVVDLDDVIVVAPDHHGAIAETIVAYVAQLLRIDRVDAAVLNRRLYSVHGHTLIGLREELGLRVTLAEFNAAVYSPGTLAAVSRLPKRPATAARAAEVARLVARMRGSGVSTYVFSNAPRAWCDFALREIGLANLFAPDRILTSDAYAYAPLLDDLVLKPSSLSYELAQRSVGTDDIAFVDDSPRNLAAAPSVWRKFLMCNGAAAASETSVDARSSVIAITSLDQLVGPPGALDM